MQSSQLLPLGSLLLSFATPLALADALHDQASALFKPIPEQVTELRGQPISEQQRELGKKLFFDPRLSRSHVLSCNTCHNVGTGGADNVPTSVGHGWQKGPRNSPTVFNAVFNAAQFWDGRAKDLGEQAKGPIQNSVEMHSTPQLVEQTLGSIPEYVDAFRKAFPKAGKPVSFDNMALAIEAYEATLVTPDSPFDLYLKGDEKALDAQQKKGLKAFMDSGCSACHNGINLGGQAYFPFGLVKKPDASVLPSGDKGRFTVTKTQSDEYVFRAPAQCRPHRAVLPQRPGLGTQGRGGDHGQRPARQAVGAGRRGEHRRLPAQPERQAAARRISAAAGQHGDHAASRGITGTRKNGAPLEPRFFPRWDDLRPRPAPASHRRP